MAQIIPPLELYNYSPFSMEGTSVNNGKLNNSFYNTYNSIYGTSTAIKLNIPATNFNNNSICTTSNYFATLYFTNTNDVLSNPIGNATLKRTYYKTQQSNIYYTYSGIGLFNIYDSFGFNYGSLIFCIKNQNFETLFDTHGSLSDSIIEFCIIRGDGYYNYLNKPFFINQYNTIKVIIQNGIRIINIPSDPSGKYIPFFIADSIKSNIPSIYFPVFQTTFENKDLQMEEYNLYCPLYLNKSLNINIGQSNILSIINKNIFNSNVFDGMFLELFSINKSNSLIQYGNILGLTFSNNYQTGSVGFTNEPGTTYPVIVLYSDNDFEYLYLNVDGIVQVSNTFVIQVNSDTTRTIYLPPKPVNYITPTIIYPPNYIKEKVIYNKFYVQTPNNSVTFGTSANVQNITLFSNIYDSYDSDTNQFGNLIGIYMIFNFILNQDNQTYTATLGYINFLNDEWINIAYVLNNGLDKIGSPTCGLNITSTIITASPGFTYSAYLVKIKTFVGYSIFNVGYIV